MTELVLPVLSTSELSVCAHAARLQASYDRFVMISHRRHIPQARAAGDRTLIFTTDWLTWRLCVEAGLEAVHFEGLLDEWPSERGDPTEAHRHSWEWVYRDGKDVTLFNGVSLGKLFVRNISWVYHAAARQFYAMDRACTRWKPREIILIGLRAELDLLSEATIRQLARDVARRHGIAVVERLDTPAGDDIGLPDRNDGYGVPLQGPAFKAAVRNLFCEALDGICRLRNFVLRKRRSVLIVSNWSTVRGLLDEMRSSDAVRAAIVIGHLPKRPAAVWDWFRRGVTMIGHPSVELSAAERNAVDVIGDRIEAGWTTPVTGMEATLREFVKTNILRSGWLHLQARETKRWQLLLHRHQPERVVVGDATNSLCRLIAEVARDQGIPIDELLNGLFVTPQRYDARTGDRYSRPVVDRLLSWGAQNNDWLDATRAPIDSAVTGYPALDSMRRQGAPAARERSYDKALVLPLYVDCDDVIGLWANIFTHLVTVVNELTQFGCAEIRVKVHPGPFNANYYSDVFAYYGLKVTVIGSGSLEPHIEWADFIVGPVNSGAFVESLANGKIYYPMRCQPTLIDDRLLGPIKCFADAESVVDAMRRDELPNSRESGKYLASIGVIPNAGRQTWMVLNEAVSESNSSTQFSDKVLKAAN